MSTLLFFPLPSVVAELDPKPSQPLREVLVASGVTCRASGSWVERPISIVRGQEGIVKEPGDWGAVHIGIPIGMSELEASRYASMVMAYSVMDVVARESIRGADWSKPKIPRGRPFSGTATSNAERQRLHRRRNLGG